MAKSQLPGTRYVVFFIPQMQLVHLYHIIRKQSGTHGDTQMKDRNCYGRWFGHRRPGEEVRTVRVIGSGPSCASCEVNQQLPKDTGVK